MSKAIELLRNSIRDTESYGAIVFWNNPNFLIVSKHEFEQAIAELEGQAVTENPDVQRLIIQLGQYKARIEKATAKLNDYFVITPRDRNKSDKLVFEAKAILKGDPK